MKRKIFLSFRPEFFRPILYDIKKYEYRKRFCKEATTAFLYLSAPVQEVIGIMELGKPIDLIAAQQQYTNNLEVLKRIESSIEGREIFAIPIESFQMFKEPVQISKLKEIEPKFNVPQCYLNIENFPNVFDFLNKQEKYEKEFINDHKEIYESNFCMTCKSMELTYEFKQKDIQYNSNEKYKIIKSGYINK